MPEFQIGDVVARKSYGGDISFKIVDIKRRADGSPIYILQGLLHRIIADTDGMDLVKQDLTSAFRSMKRSIVPTRSAEFSLHGLFRNYLMRRYRARAGKILHIDSSAELLSYCMDFYRKAGLDITTKLVSENEQPYIVRQALEQARPDILVVTGHDGIKKGTTNKNSINSYWNSQYYIQSAKEARRYEPDYNKLCIFAGACQSYFEAIMNAGANFASSPGRVVINGLDPAIIAKKVAVTDSRIILEPQEVIRLTESGSKGIGGISTRGHLAR